VEINYLTPDHEVVAALSLIISSDLTNGVTEIMKIEIRDGDDLKEVEVPPTLVGGSFDVVRPHLHSIIDNILDDYEQQKELRDVNLRRRHIKQMDEDDGKPITWKPRGK